MPVITDAAQIDSFLTRGVENVFPARDFVKARLLEGKQLTMYLGVDPTGPTLHLGHAIPLMKLREFQDLGHKVILLIGDFTAMIGDPTDKSAARKRLTRKEVLANAKNYKKQASTILRFSGANKAELKYNSKWLGKMSFGDVLELASHYTVQQMAERDMFAKRLGWKDRPIEIAVGNKENKTYTTESGNKIFVPKFSTGTFSHHSPVYLHEFLYPLMQGYDSVAMDVDGEIGGNDQTFNMLAGRTLMKEIKHKEKFVIATKLLTDPTGKKMGKSEGNMITLEDAPEDMFGKIMSWPDGMIVPGFEILTRVPMAGIEAEAKSDPRAAKERLASEVVRFFFDEKAVVKASNAFSSTFQKHEIPADIPEFVVKADKMNVIDLLVAAKLAASNGEARRLIDGGGVKVGGHVIEGYDAEVFPTASGVVIQKGKRHFVRAVKR